MRIVLSLPQETAVPPIGRRDGVIDGSLVTHKTAGFDQLVGCI